MEANHSSWPHRRRTSLGTSDHAVKSGRHPSARAPAQPTLLTGRSNRMWKRWSGAFWLTLYFLLNLSLTLYNKVVLNHFPFPYTLTAIHALCGTIGTFALLHWEPLSAASRSRTRRFFYGEEAALRYIGPLTTVNGAANASIMPPVPQLHGKEVIVLLLYSVLYSVNIVVSNASLRLVTVPFHQVVRSLTPLFTVLLSIVLLGKYSSRAKIVTLIPVVAGVGLATYGDYYFTLRGFFLTLLGTVLAALKTITTNLLQSKSPLLPKADLHPPLSRSSPKFPSPPRMWYEHLSEQGEPDFECPQPRGTSSAPLIETPLNRPLLPLDNPSFPIEPREPQVVLPASPSVASKAKPIFLERSHSRLHSITPALLAGNTPTLQRLRRLMLDFLDLPKLTLSPLQLLYLLSPIAFIQCTLLAHYSGELQLVNIYLNRVTHEYMKGNLDVDQAVAVTSGLGTVRALAGLGASPRFWLLLNGVLAFFLNVVSFNANRKVGALAMSVSANVKQVLAVLCSVALFNLQVTMMNGLGIFLTIVGGAWYAAVELKEKKSKIETT